MSNKCRNCGGNGKLLLRFCSEGPRMSPFAPPSISTFVEKPGRGFRDGWYKVEQSLWFTCHHCNGFGVYAEEPEGAAVNV
jgi:hypothetical protein